MTPAEPATTSRRMRIRDLLAMSTGHQTEPSSSGSTDVDEDVPRASRAAQAGHASSSTTRRPPTCSRPSCRRRPGRRCSTTCSRGSSSRSASSTPRVGDQPAGHQHRRLRPVACAPRTSRASASSICRRASGRASSSCRPTGSAAATARQTSNGSSPTSDWDQGYGYQFWRSPPQVVPRRRRARPVLHGAAGAGRRGRDHQRHARHAGRDEPGLGEAAAGAGRGQAAREPGGEAGAHRPARQAGGQADQRHAAPGVGRGDLRQAVQGRRPTIRASRRSPSSAATAATARSS